MLHPKHRFSLFIFILIPFLLNSCIPVAPTSSPQPEPTLTSAATLAAEDTPIPLPSTADPAPTIEAINPLTGLPVQDPSLLQIPAALVSISHFPVTARPQAGLSFAPYVFEIYITEGATRFLTAFYGQFPEPEVPITGDCEIRREIFMQTGLILGNRIWHDENGNGIQDAWERGMGGVCVDLYDENRQLVQQTATDTNGYYGFNVEAGRYHIAVSIPDGMEFTQRDIQDDEQDSDVDPATGWTEAYDISSSLLHVDAGLIPLNIPLPSSELPPAKVGPVRSGRLVYADIAGFFPESCLIYAFASPEVLVELPQCAFVHHDIQGGGYMLEIDEMIQHTKGSRTTDLPLDYSSNIYSYEPPSGGVEASRLHIYMAWLNQSAWVYDPLYQSWWRYVDNANAQTAGEVHPEADRLTGRQLHFENVIVLYAEHEVISPTNLSIHLEQDWVGDAVLFRDGQKFDIRWNTVASEEEIQSGRRHPVRFLYPDDRTPFPLKPGHTWVIVVTPETSVAEKSSGEWLLQFHQPPGAK